MKNKNVKKFDLKGSEALFKAKLCELIEKDFRKTWNDTEMDSSIVSLELSKREAVDGSLNWRPAHLSAEEQARAHILKLLAKQRKSLLDQIAEQESQMAVKNCRIFNNE